MFYCALCAEKKEWPTTLFVSFGRCEVCRVEAACSDMPASMLPDQKPQAEESQ